VLGVQLRLTPISALPRCYPCRSAVGDLADM
jgi:hypothetical protein